MYFDLKGLKLAVIGGGDPCAEILDHLTGPGFKEMGIQVLMVADTIDIVKGTGAKKNPISPLQLIMT